MVELARCLDLTNWQTYNQFFPNINTDGNRKSAKYLEVCGFVVYGGPVGQTKACFKSLAWVDKILVWVKKFLTLVGVGPKFGMGVNFGMDRPRSKFLWVRMCIHDLNMQRTNFKVEGLGLI